MSDTPAPESLMVRTVFLSSTVRDIGSLRSEVKLALSVHFKYIVEALPLEQWDFAADPEEIIALCRQRVFEADAFVLVLGLRYGWVPPGHEESITHMEFRWAREKWEGESEPRVLVLAPVPGGETWRELRKDAEGYLHDLNAEARARHKVALDAFHREAMGGGRAGLPRWDWRYVQNYSGKLDLHHTFKEWMSMQQQKAVTRMMNAMERVEGDGDG